MIRVAERRDTALLLAITRAAFAETSVHKYPSSALRESWNDAQSAITAGSVLRFVDDRPVAACRFFFARDALVFSRLCVLPARRGKGHASALLSWLESLAVARDCQATECSARSIFPDNRPFYLRRGYAVMGYESVYGVPQLRTLLRRGSPEATKR